MTIHRGDVYYIKSAGVPAAGCEIRSGRPAVIVSNDMNNQFSTVVEVVYLTLKNKKPIPTHVKVCCGGKHGTAMCEQVTSVSVDRLSDLIGCCTPGELEQIDKAIMVSLGIERQKEPIETTIKSEECADPVQMEKSVDAIEEERDLYKHLYESLLHLNLESIAEKRWKPVQ